jgi:hypothetical protein
MESLLGDEEVVYRGVTMESLLVDEEVLLSRVQ